MNMTQALAADQAKLEALGADVPKFSYQLDLTLHIGMTTVESSNIQAVGYHPALGMVIEFLSGGVYAYPTNGQRTVDGMLEAESKGKFFHQFIKAVDAPFVQLI